MKKTLIALSVLTFVMIGIVAINSVVAKQVNTSVYDDPPKKDVKSKKSCCSHQEMKDCKTPCTEKKEVKADNNKKEATTAKSVSTETKDATKANPDKK